MRWFISSQSNALAPESRIRTRDGSDADSRSTTPLVGASGAIAGVVAAYLLLYPRVKMWVLILMRLPLKLSAMWVIAGWLAFQLFNAVINVDQETAWWAHVGGFVAGALLTPFLRHPDVPLFGRDRIA